MCFQPGNVMVFIKSWYEKSRLKIQSKKFNLLKILNVFSRSNLKFKKFVQVKLRVPFKWFVGNINVLYVAHKAKLYTVLNSTLCDTLTADTKSKISSVIFSWLYKLMHKTEWTREILLVLLRIQCESRYLVRIKTGL